MSINIVYSVVLVHRGNASLGGVYTSFSIKTAAEIMIRKMEEFGFDVSGQKLNFENNGGEAVTTYASNSTVELCLVTCGVNE